MRIRALALLAAVAAPACLCAQGSDALYTHLSGMSGFEYRGYAFDTGIVVKSVDGRGASQRSRGLANCFRTVDRHRGQAGEQFVEFVVHDASAVSRLRLIIAILSRSDGQTPTIQLRRVLTNSLADLYRTHSQCSTPLAALLVRRWRDGVIEQDSALRR